MKDKPLRTIDDVIEEIKGKSIEEIAREEAAEGGPWLISVDELRAAGALDVPAAWRKSLGGEPDLFDGLLEEDRSGADKGRQVQVDASDEAAANGDS